MRTRPIHPSGAAPKGRAVGILGNEVGPAEPGNTEGSGCCIQLCLQTSPPPGPRPFAGLQSFILRHQSDTIENHAVASKSLTVHDRLGKEFGYSDIQRSACTLGRGPGRSDVHLCHPAGLRGASTAGCARPGGTGWMVRIPKAAMVWGFPSPKENPHPSGGR